MKVPAFNIRFNFKDGTHREIEFAPTRPATQWYNIKRRFLSYEKREPNGPPILYYGDSAQAKLNNFLTHAKSTGFLDFGADLIPFDSLHSMSRTEYVVDIPVKDEIYSLD